MYQTFMNAYTLVDSQTRKKLDEMLKTWKEPVPGSLDTRPVFPVEITRSIENALIKARTAALQQQQARGQHELLGRGRGVTTPPNWTHSPTPPLASSRYPSSSGQNLGPQYGHGHQPAVSEHLILVIFHVTSRSRKIQQYGCSPDVAVQFADASA